MESEEKKLVLDLEELMSILTTDKQEKFCHIAEKLTNTFQK